MIELMTEEQQPMSNNVVPSIKIVGVGGAGGNTVNSLMASGCEHVYCIAANTDVQALGLSKAQEKIQMGIKATKGLGTGANPELGKSAAEEDLGAIMAAVGGADIVFLTAGMGGGTGSGALPVIARALKEEGILSIALVTKPFLFEGKRRAMIAQEAIDLLSNEVDSIIVIPNQRLLEVVEADVSMIDAFSLINDMLSKSVRGIADIIVKPGYINVDFADVKAIMKGMGLAIMGTGSATGEDRAKQAALAAISSPLLENMHIQGARGVLLNITGSSNLRLHEMSDAASIIYEQAAEDAHIILGSVIDDTLVDEVVVTVIATGFTQQDVPLVVRPIISALIKHDITKHEGKSCPLVMPVPQEESVVVNNTELANSDPLDEPTFLRRQQQEGRENLK